MPMQRGPRANGRAVSKRAAVRRAALASIGIPLVCGGLFISGGRPAYRQTSPARARFDISAVQRTADGGLGLPPAFRPTMTPTVEELQVVLVAINDGAATVSGRSWSACRGRDVEHAAMLCRWSSADRVAHCSSVRR